MLNEALILKTDISKKSEIVKTKSKRAISRFMTDCDMALLFIL